MSEIKSAALPSSQPAKRFNTREFFRKYTMIIALVVVTVAFCLWDTVILKQPQARILLPTSIAGLITENGYVFVLAAGMLLCILTGGNIDLSVGSVVCFSAAIGCSMMAAKVPWWIATIAMLAIGLCIGCFQGFWIAKIHVPAFIATLAGMYAFRGFTNVVLNGMRVDVSDETFLALFGNGKTSYIPDVIRNLFPGLNDVFTKDNVFLKKLIGENFVTKFNVTCLVIGVLAAVVFAVLKIHKMKTQKKMGIAQSLVTDIISTVLIDAVIIWISFKLACSRGFPMVLIWIALVLGIANYITTKTCMGRHLYAVGGNEKAAALSGIKTPNVYWFAYSAIGLLAGLAGVLTAARAKGIDPVYGEGYEMDAIAACFIGGASAYGGSGKVSGMIIGALLMGVINKGMGIFGVDVNYQKVVKGLVLLVAVLFDVLTKKQKR